MSSKLVGQQLEHYRIEAVVGTGGMGTVYRALDVNLARPVAMKVMHPHFAAQPHFQLRFQQEAQAAARLDHPSIVGVYHFGRRQDLLYIVMELVPGLSLGAYIKQLSERKQIVRLDETVLLMAQVADALAYAHRRGVVHRDVKPDNIIVKKLEQAPPGALPLRAVVTDFGLAKVVEGGVQTQSGEFMGTLAYVSPEQVLDQPLDGRSDIYSLGVVLFQLATGHLPFEIRTPSDAVMKHLHEPPPAPHTLQPGLPPALEAVILKALAKKPEERYQSGDALAGALRQAASALDAQEVSHFVESSPSSVVSIVVDLEALPVLPLSGQDRDSDALHNTRVRGRDRLLITPEGADAHLFTLFKRAFTLGRSESSDIVLPGTNVSRLHARLERSAGTWQITDVGSTNGTFLEGQQLTPDVPARWRDGQTIQIGAHRLRLQTAAAAPEAAADGLPARAPARQPAPARRIVADMRPRHLADSGVCRVLVLNQGDVRTTVQVGGSDPHDAVRFDAPTKHVTIAPGQKGIVDFYVEPRKRPFLGRTRALPFSVQISSDDRQWERLAGEIEAHPPLAPWLWLLLLITTPLVIVLLLFATGLLN